MSSRRHGFATAAVLALLSTFSLPCWAIEPGAVVNGAAMSPLWIVPFAGILLSIALMPVTAPAFWHHHFGKTTAFWTLAFIVPFAVQFGPAFTAQEVMHTLITEYVPFVILLFALFTVAGGIHVGGALHGTAARNTGLLAIGTLLASVMGTTGASMLLIRPLLSANDNRRHRAHVVVFFIFLVANIGGALTPLGDPPLFLGFLKGISFFWTTKAMMWPTLMAATFLLALFYAVDRWLWRRDVADGLIVPDPTPDRPLKITGTLNVALLVAIVGVVLLSGVWKPDLEVRLFGATIKAQNALRDVTLICITIASLRLTPRAPRAANQFSFRPMIEVAILFAGIFLTIIPALAILRAGHEGVLAPVLGLLTAPGGEALDARYFWLTGMLSSVLDNAPTYLVFFSLAGGDPVQLMGPMASTLAAISAGAVFMGANTYIGNAPNFMVKSIAESRGVRMPSFFAYLGWSLLVLGPMYLLLTWLFFS